jgi:hypothetical protein
LPVFSEEEYIVCFESAAQAILAEESLVEGNFSVRVMPVPSGIRAGCGFCLRFIPEELERAVAFLSERGLVLTEAYIRDDTKTSGFYKKISLANGKINATKH